MDASDLFAYDLNPSEFMAACYMLASARDGVVRMHADEVAQVLKCSRASAYRVLSGLVDKGLFARPTSGVFLVNSVSPVRQEVPPVSQSVSPVRQNRYVYVADYGYRSSGLATDLLRKSVGVQAPVKGDIELRYDYESEGDDLFGIGAIDRPTPKPKRNRRAEIKYHRTVPREDWDMTHVAKEFRHRLATMRPDLSMDSDTPRLLEVLRVWQGQNGVTPQEMAATVDNFWNDADRARTMRAEPAPWRQFLQFAKVKTNRSSGEWTEEELAALDEEYGRG